MHSDFGNVLNGELNAFASRSSKSLEEDKSYLDGQLESFGQAIKKSKASVEKQHEDALALNAEVARAQADLQDNLMSWMNEQRQAAEKAILNIRNVQETHLAVVSRNQSSSSALPHVRSHPGGYGNWPHLGDSGCLGDGCFEPFQGRFGIHLPFASYHPGREPTRGMASRSLQKCSRLTLNLTLDTG